LLDVIAGDHRNPRPFKVNVDEVGRLDTALQNFRAADDYAKTSREPRQ
jgi:hypothetical protein